MRLLPILLLIAISSAGQINRSANQLAVENIGWFVTEKLFKSNTYQPLKFVNLQSVERADDKITRWRMHHQFCINGNCTAEEKKLPCAGNHYNFIFYLDEKMKVVLAERRDD
ncbi:MAG: hypothetical protein V4676_04150 [Bacteroidota bacterium]